MTVRLPPLALFLLSLSLLILSHFCYGMDKQLKKNIVGMHNKLRSETPASNMLKMRWDKNLEKIAKDYASNCIWGHNLYRGFAGENLFARAENPSFMEAIKSWYSEIQHFSPAMMTCDSDETCGHYTQVVWADSDRVGCAEQHCPVMKNIDLEPTTYLICNYAPPGNIEEEKPYLSGPACSKCPKGYICDEKLCSFSKSNGIGGGKMALFVSVLSFILLAVWDSV